jgi:HNH endonuclease
MSYESRMLKEFVMPSRVKVQRALLRTLLKHGGVVKEFAAGEQVVDELANQFRLNSVQRAAALETVYRKENRRKKTLLWHRLLFRAADALASDGLVSRPTQTSRLTGKREWMLTERGFDEALRVSDIPTTEKDSLQIKSYEVQKVANNLLETPRPENYQPFDRTRKLVRTTRETALRIRGFRQAVIEIYDFRCAVCGLKINSPDSLCWEVEAAHIVPHGSFGRDDIFNGIALCRFHHWAFDVGWFTLLDDFKILASSRLSRVPDDFGRMGGYQLIRALAKLHAEIHLPNRRQVTRTSIRFDGIASSFSASNVRVYEDSPYEERLQTVRRRYAVRCERNSRTRIDARRNCCSHKCSR